VGFKAQARNLGGNVFFAILGFYKKMDFRRFLVIEQVMSV